VAGLGGYVNAAGGFRTGIVAAPLTGRVVAQAVCGEAPAVALGPFAADRFRPAAVRRTPALAGGPAPEHR
jgi:glycine/D-amino acid oxidase-like deaminating enzyme